LFLFASRLAASSQSTIIPSAEDNRQRERQQTAAADSRQRQADAHSKLNQAVSQNIFIPFFSTALFGDDSIAYRPPDCHYRHPHLNKWLFFFFYLHIISFYRFLLFPYSLF